MNLYIFIGLMIPFIGTSLGTLTALFFKKGFNDNVEKVMIGFAAGVMVAASIWSLLIPSLDLCADMGKLSFIPALIGLLAGFGFELLIDTLVPHMHIETQESEGLDSPMPSTYKMVMAVIIHNIPEGIAVGVALSALLQDDISMSLASIMALTLGIAIQNFPEGAIVSIPLTTEFKSVKKGLLWGLISGVVEPIAGFITILFANQVTPLLPYLLSFAAGAMLYVVVEELIPQSQSGQHSNWATVGFALGFALMMVLDVALS